MALVDVHMPGIDGPETVTALKKIEPDLTFCFMCGSTGNYRTEELLALGARHIFMKPFVNWGTFVRMLWSTVVHPEAYHQRSAREPHTK